METIIGLGQAGCNIADEFKKYDEYDVYKIDVGLNAYEETPYGDFPKEGLYNMPWQSTPEGYEESCPNMKTFFKDIKGEILFIFGGSGDISGASLRVLHHLQGRDISVLYVRPDIELLPEKKRMQERVTFNVLQEYARSAVFKRIFLIDNTALENHIGDVPLIGYHDKLNEMIVSTIHMINVYNHIESVTDTFSDPFETARISTIGLLDIADGKLLNELSEELTQLEFKEISKIVKNKTVNSQIKATYGAPIRRHGKYGRAKPIDPAKGQVGSGIDPFDDLSDDFIDPEWENMIKK